MPTPFDFVATSRAVAELLSDYKERIDTEVAPEDEMFRGNLDDYLSVAHSAVAQIGHTMIGCGRTSLARILDLPCGHGRVMRGLRAAFPEAEIVGCDVNRPGVDFCARKFRAIPVYSDPDPAEIPLEGEFDLIWVGSLLTHLDVAGTRAFLELFRRRLAPGGLLLFSSHGRSAVERWSPEDRRSRQIAKDFQRRGYGYRDHHGVDGYGTSAFTAAWAMETLTEWDDLMVVGYAERGLADHQDLISVLKMDVHHPQNDLLLV